MSSPEKFPSKSAAWGLFNQKPRWSFSLRGWLLFIALFTLLLVVTVLRLHPFLAVNKPLPTDILVVEGWIAEHNIQAVAAEFKKGGYKRAYATGGRVNWKRAADFGGTYAGYCAMRLQRAGLETNSVVAVPSDDHDWQRTFQSALALKNYLQEHHEAPQNLNVITLGPHARRTRLLYQRALGDQVSVGIIALKRDDYDPARWWRSSTGLREVISETAAYLYVRLIPSSFGDD
jgi:hypothetical protein